MKYHESMWESKFESMGEDIMVEVFMKVAQNLKAVIRLRIRCVSKSWRRLVNSRCLPKLTTCNDNPLELKGHLLKMQYNGWTDMIINCSPLLAYTAHRCCQGGDHRFGQEEEGLLDKIKSNEEKGLVFLDACNGLILHRLNSSSPSPPVYRVSNLETKSCVVVNGEADTADSMFNKTDHASLAYNPAESLMSFKIVVFFLRPLAGYKKMRYKCMRIYSSKTSKWTPDLNFDHLLDFGIRSHRWLQQSVYLNGAVYRSLRGYYLLRFETEEDEGNFDERPLAQAISLPQGAHLFTPHQYVHVGINKGQLSLASVYSQDHCLKVWVLHEEPVHGNYQWIPKHHFRPSVIPGLEFNLPYATPVNVTCPVGFHPNEEAVVIITVDHFQFRFSCYHLLHRKLIRQSVSTSYDYAIRGYTDPQEVGFRPYSFPIFSCAVPLISEGGTC